MCKTLYRFEDKYGMHTIVSKFKHFNPDMESDSYKFGDTYIQFGLSCQILGIERVILVFDLDGTDGGVLTYKDVYKKYTPIEGVEILYFPMAWCAETLLYYQIDNTILDAEVYPVAKMLKLHLTKITGMNVKDTPKVLNPDILRDRLSELDTTKLLDRHVIEYLLGIYENTFTIENLEPWMNKANNKFWKHFGWWRK